jgi:hypothetical protein
MTSEIKKSNIKIGQRFSTVYELTVESELPITANNAWKILLKSETLLYIAQGIMSIKPVSEPFPQKWEQSKNYKSIMYMYGIIPYGGIHSIFFKKIDHENHIIETEESNKSFRMWNHTMHIIEKDYQRCIISDVVLINNGWLSLISVKWALYYYRHRHKRWLEIITLCKF